jgi:hypothetical protein
MLHHHKGTSGYAYLYLMLMLFVLALTSVFAGLGSTLGMDSAGQIAGGVIFVAFWIIGFIVMQRFLAVENRAPTLSESNAVGVKTVLTVLGTVLAIGLCIALFVIILKLIGSLFGEGGAAEGRGRKPGDNADQNKQAVQTLMGVFGTLLVLYAAPFLNLAVLSRFFKPVPHNSPLK